MGTKAPFFSSKFSEKSFTFQSHTLPVKIVRSVTLL